MDSNTLKLTEGRIGGSLIRFAIPFLLSGLFQVLYGTVDVWFVGHFAGGNSIAGVSSAAQAMGLVTNMFMGLTMGGTVLIGQYMGAQRYEDCGRVTGNVVILFAGIAVVMTGIVVFFGSAINGLMNVPPDAVSEANDYIRVCGIGSVFIIGYNVVSAILRGLGNSKAPLYFVAVASLTNIVLDFIFVALFHWNAFGAALATIISQGVSLIIGIIYIKKTGLPYAFGKAQLKADRVTMGRILKIGIPAASRQTLVGFSFTFIMTITNGLGVAAAAGAGVVNRAIDVCMIIPASMNGALTSFTAQNVGAGKPERARKGLYLCVGLCLCVAVPYTLFANISPETVVGLLSSDADVIREGAQYLRPFSWDCVLVSFVFCLNAFFTGLGKTTFVLIHDTFTTFLIRVPIVYFVSTIPGRTMFQMGLGTPAATLVSLALCLIYLKVKCGKRALAEMTVA
ncbi:MAG: MATE family efflux transporter [Oscillospiraceae bacterium]|jgi:putative MATE family efflux protein|nr:MATE family efflux transporter [Oscillospiraceae bacterium]